MKSIGSGGVTLSKRRHDTDDVEMDITPMIDITFLLLIFFLVASKMDEGVKVMLAPAKYGTPVPGKEAVILTVLADGDKSRVFRGDGQTDEIAGDDDAVKDAVINYVVEGLTGSPPKQYVIVKCERDLKHREVARVLAAVNGAKAEVPTLTSMHIAVMQTSTSDP